MYLDYISLVQEQRPSERRRRGSGSRRDSVLRLMRALPTMEARSFEQCVAQSEMARTVADIIVSTTEMVIGRRERINNSEQGHRRIDEITITGRRCPENYQESGRRDAGSSPCGVDSRMG